MLDDLLPILVLQGGYNTNQVLAGSVLLGVAGGVVGVFSLLRKRALISDAISHATLPGLTLGFLVALKLTGSGKSLPILLLGSTLSAICAVLLVQWIKNRTRLPEDAAIGTVLSTFFGAGVVLLSYIQTLGSGSQAGLESYMLGSTASMLQGEATLIGCFALVIICLAVLFLKEFGLVCFDAEYAGSRGWRVDRIDLLIMGLLLAVVVIGLKTVGLVLIIALVIIPPVTARFWTDRLGWMVVISGLCGALSCYLGASFSAVAPNLPSGAAIVLTATGIFLFSLLVSPRRGLVAHSLRLGVLRYRVKRRHALLALHGGGGIYHGLMALLLWRQGVLDRGGRPTPAGTRLAAQMAHDQCLWNQYLERYPQEALAQPRWSLAPIQDVLSADRVADLERCCLEMGTPVAGSRATPGKRPAEGAQCPC